MNSEGPEKPSGAVESPERYRVFLSYSHDNSDEALLDLLVECLKEEGLTPVWDRHLASGFGFSEQIKQLIAHAHVFMPLITDESSKRGWVHQEIGYALGLNVPVLPVCHKNKTASDAGPGEMLEHLQAIILPPDDVSVQEKIEEKRDRLRRSVFANLIARYDDPALAYYRCSELREERAAMIATLAREVRLLQDTIEADDSWPVRQRGGLSSFNIPHQVISDPIWIERNHGVAGRAAMMNDPEERQHAEREKFHWKRQRQERLELEQHARRYGCRLIINPKVFQSLPPDAQAMRMETLMAFLRSMEAKDEEANDKEVIVAVNDDLEREINTTIVGDWFAADSISMEGPRQTNFTTHAPSIGTRIKHFDRDLDELLRKKDWKAKESRVRAIEYLEERIAELRR